MADYKESVVTGDERTWQRAYEMVITNAFGTLPTLTFKEEVRTTTPSGKSFAKPVPGVQLSVLFEPMRPITLINPQTDEPLTEHERQLLSAAILSGVVPQSMLHICVYSLYKERCAERDAVVMP